MRFRFWAALLLFAAVAPVGAALATQAGESPTDAGAAFVAALNDSIDRAGAVGPGAAGALCADVSEWALDLDAMSAAVSGEAWAAMSKPDQAAFREAFKQKIVRDCAGHAGRTLGSRVELAGARRLSSGEWMLATRSRMSAVSASTMMWRGHVDDALSFRVTDVLIDGRSAVGTARDGAAEALRQAGGDAAALIGWARR